MPYDKIDQLYDKLKKDGAVSKSREHFRGKILAPGKEGYQNRLQLYNALKADGAVDCPTYEEFRDRLELHAVKAGHPVSAAGKQQKTATPPSAIPAQSRPRKNQPLTLAQRQAMTGQARQALDQTQAMIADTNERMKDMKRYGVGLGFGQTKEGGATYNPRTKKLERTYITPTGNRYSSKALADAESFHYRQEASKPFGLDMNAQQVAAAQKPADAAVAALWKEAEAKYAADRDKNAEKVYGGNPWLHAGREMHIVDAAINSHKNEMSRLTRFDLQKMMDNAWGRVGKRMTASCYAQLKKQYPTATEQQLRNSASAMARRLSDNAVYKYAVAKNTPKSTLEFFAKTAADTNLLRAISKGLARSEAGTTGDLAAYEQAMSDYGKNHRWAQIGGTVTGMMFDPTTYISGGVGSFASKTALNIGGRVVARKAATNVGARLFGKTLTGRVVAGMAGGAGNLGTYEGIKEGESQWLHGGHINPRTGGNGGYSAGDVLKSSLRGALLGSVTGTMSPLLGNVADKMVKATSSTAGKVGIRAGELVTSTVAEGTVFSIPEWIGGDGDAMDVWTDNMAMMMGFKGQRMIKSAPRVIAGLRPIENPRTARERNNNRMSFVERLRKQVDASPRDMAFSKEEREELRSHGYGDLATLFTRAPKQQPKPKAKLTSADGKAMYLDIPEAKVEDLGKRWLKQHPEFDGYDAMERLMKDPNVSQSARAKAYHVLTGRQLPMGSITGYVREQDGNGNIFVKSVTANGEVVTSRRFADEASAKKEQDKIMRQAELNSVDVGERYTEAKADNKVWEAAIEAVAPGADPETAKRNYQAAKEGDKDAIANYGQMVDAIDKFIEDNKTMADTERPEAIRAAIKGETGVDVDEAIKKEPSKRAEPEKAAVQDYIERLFPEQKAENERPMSDDEAGASAIYDQSRLLWDKVEKGDADAKADVGAIALRMQEAYKECEDAFGTDAEMRMAEMDDNPWALVNAPELTDDQRDAALCYVNAKAAMEGVMDASNEAADGKRKEVEANVERHTHKDTGVVQPATMKVDDKPVYVVKGNVVMLPDGSGIDARNSDRSIVICDAETGEYKFASPDQLLSLGEAIDPQAEFDEAYANIQAEHEAVLGVLENADDVPTYAQNEVLTLLDERGNPVRAEIMATANEDGLYEVLTDEPIDGKRVSMMSAEEIAAKSPAQEEPSGRTHDDTEASLQGHEGSATHEAAEPNEEKSALARIPIDEKTKEPRYEEVDADTAWDAIVEQTNGDKALAQEVVDDTVNEMSSGIEKAEKAISKATFKGKGIQERIAFAKDKQERMAALALEKERLAKWKRIASVERMRAAAVEAEKSKAAAAERKARQEEEEKARQAREEAERKEREALNGVPNMTEDKPSDARARGYRRVDGHKVDRQAPVNAVMGKEVQVKFDDKNIPAGHVAIVDASELQPSHIGGQRNAKHFIDEAQPKERKDDASVEAARKIASNIRPEEITTSVTAYTGAPTVNSRGEVIQGNNRSAALKEMWASHPGQGARYKQYLKERAAEYGLTAEDIDKVQSPVLVNMLDVSDADAIALGQFVASDTESGGTERLKPKNVTKKLGGRMKTFSNILLRSSDEESSFSELLDRNGVETLKWLNGIGAITPTQYRSSFDSKGNLTAEAKNDLKGVLYQYVFEGGSTQLEEIFNGLPAKAQRAILSTAYRDYESAHDERMIEEIQDSIMAYHALSQDAQFMSATNHKDVRAAVESWKRQYAIDDATGESYLPSEKFSNFTLLLAVMYKGDTQSYIQAKFNAMYDLIQGVREDTLFGMPDNTPRTLAEAIKEILNIDYDGRQRSDVLAGGSQVGQARGTGSPAGAERGERGTQGAEAAERGRRAEESANQRGVEDWNINTAGIFKTSYGKKNKEVYNRHTTVKQPVEAAETSQDAEQGDTQTSSSMNVPTSSESKATNNQSDLQENGEKSSEKEGATPLSKKIESASEDVDTAPTEAQKEAGNYKKGHVQVGKFDITIEQPRGSIRKGTDANGKAWESKMRNTYGYIRGTVGVDGDHIDVFLSNDIDGWDGRKVYVVDQYNPDGSFDEHKVMLGFNDMDKAKSDYLANYEKGWEKGRRIDVSAMDLEDFEKWIVSSKRKTKPFAKYAGLKKKDSQGNPLNADGTLKLEKVKSVDDLTDEDFSKPTRSVELPELPENVDRALGAEGKPVIIKKNILEKNWEAHKFPFNESRSILKAALYNTDLVGQTQPTRRPLHWVVIKLDEKSPIVVLEVNESKNNVEIVGWYTLDGRNLDRIKRQAEKNGGELVMLSPKDKVESLSTPQNDLSSDGKDTEKDLSEQANGVKSFKITPKEYITKRGKKLAMQLVTFKSELSKEQMNAAKQLAKEAKGWWSKKDGGFLMRDMESAQRLADVVLDDADAVADAQPLSLQDLSAVNDQTTVQAIDDAEDTMSTEQKSTSEQPTMQQAKEETQQEEKKAKSKWVDDADAARFEELRQRLHKKLNGQLNMGIDPEAFSIGVEMSYLMLKHGARKFGDFARRMIEALGENVRPYLKSFYNGARDLPEMADYEKEMTPYDEVRSFDVMNFDKEGAKDIFATAEHVAREQAVEREAKEATKKLKEERNEQRKETEQQVTADTETVAGEATTKGDGFVSKMLMQYNNIKSKHPDRKLLFRVGDFYETYQGDAEIMAKELGVTLTASKNGVKTAKFPYHELNVYLPKLIRAGYRVAICEQPEPPKVTEEPRPKKINMEGVTEELPRKSEEKTKKNQPKRNKSNSKSLSSQEETIPNLLSGLFGDDELKPTSNEQEVHVQARPGTSEREGGHQREQNESLGASQQHEDERADAERVVGRSGKNTMSDASGGSRLSELSDGELDVKPSKSEPAPLSDSELKNTHNNHAARGTDYAPKSTNARIDANIKAIETMQRLIESGEPATPEDMSVLRKFSGWGGLGEAFNEMIGGPYGSINPINKQLRELLSPEAYEAANMSRNSAYYTPAPVIDAMWDVARAMGFRGGNVLEGSAGIGNIIGLMPTDMSERSDIHAVEIDETTGNILSLLYPDANVEVKGFEKTFVPNGSVDLAITNVPFVTGLRVMDETGDKDLSRKFHDIHDFCIAKNVRKLKEGGIGIFISSSGTLDSANSAKLRTWLVNDGGADVVGAFRMHNQTFGGTGATSDIIVIRKRVNGKKSANAIDVSGTLPIRTVKYNTGERKRGSNEVIVKDLALDVNKHFVEHPEDMAGEMAFAFEKGETYRATSKGLYPSKSINQEQRLAEWAQQFKSMDWDKAEKPKQRQVVYEDLGADVKEGSMLLDSDGNLCIAHSGKAVPLDVNTNKVKGRTKAACFNDYKAIKDALADVLSYQTTHSDDVGLKQKLDVLNKVYDAFVKTYGHLNKNTSIAFLRNDMDYPSIAALESVSETGDKNGKRIVSYGKTDIFSRRVVETESEPKPTTIKDGIIASLYLNGRVDVPYIAKQLGENESEVREQIIKSGLGFENPTTTEMEVSYEYLSGNVREKLRQAQENNTDGRYDANIKALERVIPMNIPAHLIEFTLGSSWVDPKLYEDFVKERTGIEVKLTNEGGTWMMNVPWYTGTEQNKAMGVISEKCDKTILGHELIKAAITCKSVSVTKSVTTGYGSNRTTETIVDKEATVACANKIDEIRQDFKDWAHGKMQGDAELSERMERVYNELFNNSVPKEIPDEFVPAHFGGAATIVEGHPFQLRPHQAKAVVRATTQPLMLAHEVGTGKTYTLISTAMEMRRLGTARKPMIVVQNATVGQFVASAKALYPNAKILTLEDTDRNADGRRNFYAKIRYNDWDMIVVPQSVFERIPDSEERQMRFVEDKVEEKMMVLEKIREAAANDRDPVLRQAERELEGLNDELNDLKLALQERKSGVKTKKDEKREAKSKQNAAVKAQEMLDRETDDVVNFDDMGVDALLIDEAHEYKHLGFATAMQRGVKGVDPSYSKKSQGAYLKTQAVLESKNGKNVVFATGTPISNTAAEIWTFMRYLMPADTMREYGIYYFDDFVRNFGNVQQTLEFSTNGKYKENNRFAGYVNLPELVRIWSGIADIVRTRDAGGVSDKIPEMEGGQAKDVYLPQTKALRGVMKYVKEQLDAYENMSGKEKKENSHIPLVMYGIAKAAAVDARLVMEDAVDEPNSKTNEAVRQTLRSLEDTKDYNGAVAIFADNYQNKSTGFNLYEDIRKKLIESGVPKDEIVVMKSGMKVKKKLEIFDKVNRGEVRVIMGSTFTLGTGVNIQERLHTLIHVDAPNRPMDYTQRNGRILRQGNLHKEWGLPVRVLRFGVEDSLDVTAYQRLKTKGAIADSIMEGKKLLNNSMENRVLEEDQDLFGDITAQLSGSQYALLKNQVEKEVRKLEARKKQWEADQAYVHKQKPRLEGLIKDSKARAERNREALAKVEGAKWRSIVIGKQKFPTLDAMADYIKDYNSKQREQQEQVRKASGYNAEAKSSLTVNIGGFDFRLNRVIAKEHKQAAGQLSISFTSKTQMTYSCPELGLEDVPVDGQRLKSALEDIVNNVMSGNDFRERIEHAERAVERYKGELQQVKSREGKPFDNADELSQAKEKLSEYEKLMKAEMAEKEAKYAEMDSEVDTAKNVQLTEEDTEDDLYREVDDEESDEDISLSHDPMGKLLGESAYTDAQRKAFVERERKRMATHVSELAKKLNLDNVDVVTDASALSGKRGRAKGFFNKKTGRITIVIPNHTNMADVEKTLLHEAVAHHGLRKLFGENFDNFLDNVYRNAEYDIRKRIAGMASNHGWDVRTATEEYLAGLAEDTNFENMPDGFWSKIKRFFLRMLHSIGFKNLTGVAMGDNELRYVLWRSYENLKEPGRYRNFFAEAADVAKQHQLKVGAYEVDARKDMNDVQGAAESDVEENARDNKAGKADTEVAHRKTGFGDTKFSDGYKKSAQPNEAALKHLEPTDVEHAAKIRQKRKKAKEALLNVTETYKNTTDSKGFISDLSNSLGLTRGKTGSGYGSFETSDGKLFTIRVSNHNINAANVGDEPVESIVIKTKRSPNRFHAEEGKFANEYVYFKEDIRKAPAGTLSSIAESISELLDTGEYHDKTGLARENHSPETDPDGGIMFRNGDMGLEKTIAKMKAEASRANADNWQAKQDAMRAIGGNLNKLRQAMARQREYDLSTVKSITDLAKVLLENGMLDDLSKYETKRILSAVNNVHGKQDASDYVQKVMDIMVDNQLRMGANQLGKLLSIRGSRVDARGVEVQGQLDPEGQRIAWVVRKASSLPKENIEERIADCANRMSSDADAVAEEAAIEYSGLSLAHRFVEDITESKAEEKALRESVKEAKADLDAGTMEADAYHEYVESTNDAIRQNKIERAEAYHSMVEQVGGVLGGSVERAKAWREAEKRRVKAIHHNANSDMTGRPNDEHRKESKAQKIANNSIVRFVLAPLGTFDQMLRMFGKKSVNGEGYLWNRYMRGWVEATEKEYTGYQNALKTLDEKVGEVFGKKMKWGDLFSLERKLPKATVTFWDGGEQKVHELTQGNLLYIYMVDKMADGRMKLRRMGIIEEDLEKIKDFVDPRFLELADWMQDEFLVEKRNEYNEVHKRMFGASMAAIENYFPLKILANARIEEVDVADDTTDTALPATSTGSIIKRRRNNLALDVMGADAFSVILDHIQQMERWASFAEFNRDLNTLLSYKRFRNQVMNMTSVYGGGKTLWKNFRNVCSMAAGAYRPPIAALDKAAVNVAKGVTAAKVSFRVFTALKQLLSMPAYLSDSSPVYLAGNVANPIGAWKWSMENLPLFEKRWKSRVAGDPRLMKSEMDWKTWRNRAVEIASRIGMSPNAFVDALTVAIGARSMYQTKKKKYLRYGYDEETAKKRAKQDATILFNQTQQSSESAFLSTMQADRSWLSVLFTVFRNSSMSYTRQLYDALRNLKHRFEPGYKGLTEEYLAKQMRRDGIDPDKADRNAKSEYRRSLMRDIVRVGVFGYLLQLAWNLGAYLPYLLLGDDKDEKSDMWHDIFCHTMFGSIEGLTGGDVMSAVGNGFAKGEGLNLFYASKDMPLSSDLQNIVSKWDKDKVAAMNDVTNLMVQSGIGVNPQSLTDAVVAIMDCCGDDANTSRECALLITRVINCPQSQIDKIYFDELDATAAEAQGMTPAEIAERYARYKVRRGAPLTGWAYADETRDSVMTARQNRALAKAKEKLNGRMETEETKQLLSDYDAIAKQETALSKIKKTDREAYRKGMKQLRLSNDMRQHLRLKRYKHDMKELTSKYLRCKCAEELDSIVSTMFSTHAKMLEDIGRLKQQ